MILIQENIKQIIAIQVKVILVTIICLLNIRFEIMEVIKVAMNIPMFPII